MNSRYFAELETFDTAMEQSKSFKLVVTLDNGKVITSTSLPIEQLSYMLDIVETTESVLYIWETHIHGNILHSVPIYKTTHIGYVFN